MGRARKAEYTAERRLERRVARMLLKAEPSALRFDRGVCADELLMHLKGKAAPAKSCSQAYSTPAC